MNIKATAAIILCKALRLVSRLLHRGGTAMPGRWALKICPNLLEILAKDVKSVVITGTNGKTTSARMIEQAFEDKGLSFFANRSGANLLSGITTEFVMNCSLGGKMKKEYAVIECDEGAAKTVFRQMKPQVIVVTNLFSDQVDRYGGVTFTLESIRTAIKGSPESVLCLNADCSLTASLAKDLPNPHVFYGLEKGALENREKPEKSDAANCLYCGGEYDYSYVVFDHLGGFFCPKCGYKRSRPDYAVTDVVEQRLDGSTVIMNIKGKVQEVRVNLPAAYNIYNAAGALAAVMEMGLGLDCALSALASFKCGFGRMEHFELGKAGARMTLVKNAAGCNQVLEFMGGIKERFNLAICINNRVGDGADISWLWDAEFEKLCSMGSRIQKIFIAGDCAEDMYKRILEAGIPESMVCLEKDYEKIVSYMAEQDIPAFFMPNYTAMLDSRQVIIKHCGGADFWE